MALLVLIVLLLVLFRRRRANSADGRRAAAPTGGRRVDTADWSIPHGGAAEVGAGTLTGSTAGPASDGGSSESGSAFRAVGIAVAAPERSDADGFEPVAPETRRFCANCGSKLGQGSRFCSACGQPVR